MKLWEPKWKCPKAVPTHLQNHVVWSRILKCGLKPYVTKPSTKYFNAFLFMWVLTHDRIKLNQRLVALKVPWSPGFVFDLLPRGGSWKQSKWPCNMIHSMPRKNPCRLYIHLAFTYSIGSSRVVWSELGPAPPFSTNESAWSAMVMGSQSRVWSGPQRARHLD